MKIEFLPFTIRTYGRQIEKWQKPDKLYEKCTLNKGEAQYHEMIRSAKFSLFCTVHFSVENCCPGADVLDSVLE